MIGHSGCFRENDDLPLWRGPVVNFVMRVLITRKIMRSRDAQCNTED